MSLPRRLERRLALGPLVQEHAHHPDAVLVLGKAVVELRRGELVACSQVELVAHVVLGDAGVVAGVLLELAHHVDELGGGVRVVAERAGKAVLEARVAQGHDANAQHARVGLHPAQGADELQAVVDARADHQLGVQLDASIQQALGHLQAAVCVAAHELAAHLGRHRVQAQVKRAQVLAHDAVDVLFGHVGERDEVALHEAQAVVVVAQGEGGTHVLGQHGHEAEAAGVAAGGDAIEDAVAEGDAPILARLALEHGNIALCRGYLHLQAV